MQLSQRLFGKIQSGAGSVNLEVSSRTVALDGVAPFWNLPFELDFRKRHSLGQIHFHAVPGRFDVTDVDEASQSCCPEPRYGSAPRVERQVVASALIKPTRRHHPGVFVFEVALLRL